MATINNKLIYVTLFCAVFCFAWSTQDKLLISIPTPMVLELRQQAQICEKETGVPAAHLRKIIDKTLPKDEPNNKFFYCICLGTGLIDTDGHFTQKVHKFNVVEGTPEDYVNTINECNKISKGDGVATLIAAADCVHSNYKFAPAAQKQ